jgi:hypothetical protein
LKLKKPVAVEGWAMGEGGGGGGGGRRRKEEEG